MGIPPIKMTTLHLEIEQHPEIGSIDGTITEKHFISLSKDQNKCSDNLDGNKGFQECSKHFFREALHGVANCTIPGSYTTKRIHHSLCKFTKIVLQGNKAKMNKCLVVSTTMP